MRASLFAIICGSKQRPVTDAKEVGVGDPAEEKTFCHRTINGLPESRIEHKVFVRIAPGPGW
jgi:hypothetical protein